MINRIFLYKNKKHAFIRWFVFIIFLFFFTCTHKNQQTEAVLSDIYSWDSIQKNKHIRIGILYNYTDYYVSGGAIYGFHYKMIQKMAKELNLKVSYKVYDSYIEYYKALLNNHIDIFAADISINNESKILFDYSVPHSHSPVVLLQHKNNKFFITKDSTLASTTQEKYCLKTPKTRHYPYFFRLKAAYPMSIDAQKLAVFTEEIIEEINEGNCDFSIDYLKNIHANSIFYKNIDYSVILSTSNSLHWICKKRNDSLLTHINAWMNRFKQTPSYTFLLKKYYDPSSTTRKSILYHKNHPTLQQISPYDEIIEKHATKYQLDWLLVAALMYQESKFNVHTTGKGGSYGLMQFMPATANRWGLNIGDSPEKQIKTGCKYLHFLKQKYIKMGVTDTNDLIKFVLASYNAGSCRIEDARKLAKLQGLDENKWDNHVEVALQIFSKRKAKIKLQLRCNRFYRADRTLQYIDEVLHRYQHYKNSKAVYKNTKMAT